MSGILMAAATLQTASLPHAPLSNSIAMNGGTTYNVSGAGGDLYTASNSVIVPFDSGGVPPYTDTVAVVKDGGVGSVSIVAASDGIHNTIAWAGLAIGDSIVCHLTLHTVDSSAATADAIYPPVGQVIMIRRTS